MKKTRLLALTSLCSVLAGMPANAQEIKDSGAKKIGGVETQVSKESPNCKNKNELIKYVKWVFGAALTHELLSYFKGGYGQFYKIPARFSLTGYFRKQEELKLAEEIEFEYEIHKSNMKGLLSIQGELKEREKLKSIFDKIIKLKSNPGILSEYEIYDKELIDTCTNKYEIGILTAHKLWGSKLKKLKDALVKEGGVSEKEFEQISEFIDFYICYVKPDKEKSVSLMLTFFPRYCDHHLEDLRKVEGSEEVSEFEKDFTLLSERIV